MTTDAILGETTDYERGYADGCASAVLLRHPGSAAARIAELEAELLRERERAERVQAVAPENVR